MDCARVLCEIVCNSDTNEIESLEVFQGQLLLGFHSYSHSRSKHCQRIFLPAIFNITFSGAKIDKDFSSFLRLRPTHELEIEINRHFTGDFIFQDVIGLKAYDVLTNIATLPQHNNFPHINEQQMEKCARLRTIQSY